MAVTTKKSLLFLAGGVAAAALVAYASGALDPLLKRAPEAIAALPEAGKADQKDARLPAVEPPAATPKAPAEPAAPDASAPAAGEPAASQPETPAEAAPAEPAVVAPSFDVVRVEANGSIVIAGQAAPGATVDLLVGSNVIGSATAGPEGNFAVVLDDPLKPGDYQIVLRATAPDNVVAMSVETAVVSVPETPDGQVLALVEEPGKPSQMITLPAPQKPAEAAKPPAEAPAAETPAVQAPAAEAPVAAEPSPEQQAALPEATEPAPAPAPAPPAAAGAAVRVEAVEIDGRKIFVAGVADPGRTVRGYANEILLGDAKASPDGRYLIEADRDLKVGDYIIRVDALEPDGVKVAARAAVPFEREPGETIAAVAPPAGETVGPPAASAPAADTPVAAAPAGETTDTADPAAQAPAAAAPAAEAPAAEAPAPAAPAGEGTDTAAAAPAVQAPAAAPAAQGAGGGVPAAEPPAATTEAPAQQPAAEGEQAQAPAAPASEAPVAEAPAAAETPKPQESGEQAAAGASGQQPQPAQPAAEAPAGGETPTPQESGESAAAGASGQQAAPQPTQPAAEPPAAAPEPAPAQEPADVAEAPATQAPTTEAPAAQAPAAEQPAASAPAGESPASPPAMAEAPAAQAETPAAETAPPAAEPGTDVAVAPAGQDALPAPPSAEGVTEVLAPKLQSVGSAVIIRRGDTLWRISRRVYGRGIRYSTIYLANEDQIEDPDRIWPGQVFKVPEKSNDGKADADYSRLGNRLTAAPEEGEPGTAPAEAQQ